MPRDLIWLRPESAGVGRPAERSRAEITERAVALADAEGFGAVSMRRVAATLGTGAASLYRYVANRGELIALMLDHVYLEMDLSRTGRGWKADLIEAGLEGFRVGRRHPWFAVAVVEYPLGGPGTVRLAEHCLEVLADHPASGQRKLEAIGVMGGMVQQYLGFVTRQDVPRLMAEQAAYMRHAAQDGQHPRIAAAFAEANQGTGVEDPEVTLGRVLDMVIDGVLGPAG